MMNDVIINIENVVKEYRLGSIGGGTLTADLQTFIAKLRGKENPNSLIGSKQVDNKGDTFRALDGINLQIRKGETVGIIGHNGAGKSTLLKLLSRVTAPTSGTISYDGRIASMLEVGTGFHPELTGRENIYMNGAILGMTKKEIDSKFDEIVRFAEMEKFIDTPVKRYSSGMYVKLAFAVAAHLDSEIMIMDEVLAVGDMAFQTKCLDKMSDVSKKDGRTILYISHNMTTIRQLCERCIVLDHGTVIFDGDVEQAIAIYQNKGKISFPSAIDYSNLKRMDVVHTDTQAVSFESLQFPGRKEATFNDENIMPLILEACVKKPVKNAALRIEFYTMDDRGVCAVFSQEFDLEQVGRKTMEFDINISELVAGEYKGVISLYSVNEYGTKYEIDAVAPAFCVKINRFMNIEWLYRYWGNVKLNNFAVTVANKQNGIANERRT
ncbi:MAG: ABC transporter ATP-binding protein [Ruminococcaceae bacterium]|nr:ABC transporter ATP-binding protein [Oscillospiraceae bacterium]